MSNPPAPHPAPGCHGQDLGDEYLFYDRDSDQVHVLNGTAREIFLLCDGARSDEEIARTFAERYDVEAETARADALRTLDELVRLGLLTRG
jgi:PqqD family protein of HPr-rel-A system